MFTITDSLCITFSSNLFKNSKVQY